MNGSDPAARVGYVAEFLRAAWGGLNDMFTVPSSQLESFGMDGTDAVHATVVVAFRGRRFSYRRQIWPSDHPALLRAQLYTTFLEERLNTRPPPAPDAAEPIELLPVITPPPTRPPEPPHRPAPRSPPLALLQP